MGEKVIKVAHCVLNTEQNFPTSTRQFIDSVDFEGKLIDYIQDSPMWNDDDNEYEDDSDDSDNMDEEEEMKIEEKPKKKKK